MTGQKTFNPAWGKGVAFTAGAVATHDEIDATANKNGGSSSIVVTNLGSEVAYVRTYSSDAVQVATTADYPVLGGTQVSLTKFRDHDRASVISAGGTTLQIIKGDGF